MMTVDASKATAIIKAISGNDVLIEFIGVVISNPPTIIDNSQLN